jgi:hypothetical protein
LWGRWAAGQRGARRGAGLARSFSREETMSTTDQTIIGRALETKPAESIVRRLAGRRMLDRLGALFLLLSVLAVAIYGLLRPDYNWDMVAYIASALENRVAEAEALHAETWARIEPGVTEAQEYHLKFSNPYNRHQWENPEDFQSQLSMYLVKVAYIGLLRLLEPVVGLVPGAVLLSILPSLGVGFLCLWWLWRAEALQGAFFLLPFLLLADYSRMTSAALPDMLLVAVSLPALYAFWRGRDWLGSALLFGSVFIRPDNIILIFALLIAAVRGRFCRLPCDFQAGRPPRLVGPFLLLLRADPELHDGICAGFLTRRHDPGLCAGHCRCPPVQ